MNDLYDKLEQDAKREEAESRLITWWAAGLLSFAVFLMFFGYLYVKTP